MKTDLLSLSHFSSTSELRGRGQWESTIFPQRGAHRHKQPVRTAVSGDTVEENGKHHFIIFLSMICK